MVLRPVVLVVQMLVVPVVLVVVVVVMGRRGALSLFGDLRWPSLFTNTYVTQCSCLATNQTQLTYVAVERPVAKARPLKDDHCLVPRKTALVLQGCTDFVVGPPPRPMSFNCVPLQVLACSPSLNHMMLLKGEPLGSHHPSVRRWKQRLADASPAPRWQSCGVSNEKLMAAGCEPASLVVMAQGHASG